MAIMGRVSDAKERLMKAVSELIWTGSYGNTTIDQICEKAGVKTGRGNSQPVHHQEADNIT